MIFSDLTFNTPDGIRTQAIHKFPNGWQVSIVAAPRGFGIFGILGEDTFEVAIFTSKDNMLEDVIPYQTPSQISTILRVVEML